MMAEARLPYGARFSRRIAKFSGSGSMAVRCARVNCVSKKADAYPTYGAGRYPERGPEPL